jgi:2-keto-4-pentenoate hydratase
VAALRAQQRRRQAELHAGAERVGWKIGRGIAEGEEQLEPVVGYLLSTTVLEPGEVFDGSLARSLRVDAEVALEIGADGRAARFGAALELVDVVRPPHDFETIVAENIWHRGVAFGPMSERRSPETFTARVVVNGEVRDETEGTVDVEETVGVVRTLVSAIGTELRQGDRIIAGSLLHVPVGRGDVTVDLGPIGRVGVTIT